MKMKYFADSDRKMILVSAVIYPLGTYLRTEYLSVPIIGKSYSCIEGGFLQTDFRRKSPSLVRVYSPDIGFF